MSNAQSQDPMEFVRSLWGGMGFSLPGMVTPTLDVGELEKRITDLKAVEGWLRMNLSMLQMTIQGLEMQKTTLNAVQAMGKMATASSAPQGGPQPTGMEGQTVGETLSQAALWPWNLMQQMQEQLQQNAASNTSGDNLAPSQAGSKGKKST